MVVGVFVFAAVAAAGVAVVASGVACCGLFGVVVSLCAVCYCVLLCCCVLLVVVSALSLGLSMFVLRCLFSAGLRLLFVCSLFGN